jgi:phospholipid/cholesterol/gamma-HCH transport system substrate-binding protein
MSAAAQAKTSSASTLETLIGAAVVLAAAAILLFVWLGKGGGAASGYPLSVRLVKADGLGAGTEVRLSGIKVGSVTELTLDPATYLVTVHMNIDSGVRVPVDSSIMVNQAGLLGGGYLSITPGGDDKMLAAGGMIENAQGSIDLMSLISKFATGGSGASTPAPRALPEGP